MFQFAHLRRRKSEEKTKRSDDTHNKYAIGRLNHAFAAEREQAAKGGREKNWTRAGVRRRYAERVPKNRSTLTRPQES